MRNSALTEWRFRVLKRTPYLFKASHEVIALKDTFPPSCLRHSHPMYRETPRGS